MSEYWQMLSFQSSQNFIAASIILQLPFPTYWIYYTVSTTFLSKQ